MATNTFLPFAPTDTGTNLLDDTEYQADAQRLIGHQPGVARAELANKALRQATAMAAGCAQFLVDQNALDAELIVGDNMSTEALAALWLSTLTALADPGAPANGYETPGMVAPFPSAAPPPNWLRCNGSLILRASYPALFARIGTLFGTTLSTNFRLPDLRGEFIRGWDDSRGVDGGRALGSYQEGTHVCGDDGSSIGTHAPANMAQVSGDPADGAARLMAFVGSGSTTTTTSGPGVYWRRVRPRNIALLYCIKF